MNRLAETTASSLYIFLHLYRYCVGNTKFSEPCIGGRRQREGFCGVSVRLESLWKYSSGFALDTPRMRPGWARRLADAVCATYFTRRFATFLLFGGMAAAVNIGVGASLYGSPSIAAWMPYWLAVGLGAVSGLLLNFVLNYTYNFDYRARSAFAQLATFTVVASGGIVLTVVVAEAILRLGRLATAPEQFELMGAAISAQQMAHMASVAFVTFYSFAAHSAFSFNRGLRKRLPELLHPTDAEK